MSKYLVETYYTCTFKVNHYLDNVDENELKNLEKRDDGKFEVLDVKLDNRKTKSLDPNNKIVENKKIDVVTEINEPATKNIENLIKSKTNNQEKNEKRFSMPDRRKYIFTRENMRMVKLEKYLLIQAKKVSLSKL